MLLEEIYFPDYNNMDTLNLPNEVQFNQSPRISFINHSTLTLFLTPSMPRLSKASLIMLLFGIDPAISNFVDLCSYFIVDSFATEAPCGVSLVAVVGFLSIKMFTVGFFSCKGDGSSYHRTVFCKINGFVIGIFHSVEKMFINIGATGYLIKKSR